MNPHQDFLLTFSSGRKLHQTAFNIIICNFAPHLSDRYYLVKRICLASLENLGVHNISLNITRILIFS